MRIWIGALPLIAALLPAPPAAAQTCAELGPIGALIERMADGADAALAAAFCADYGAMATRLSEAELAAEQMRVRIGDLEASLPPAEAILLLDRAQGCPAGWIDMALAEPQLFAGRVPVATGFAEGRVFRGFREAGGSETHALTEAQLPSHVHDLPLAFVRLPGEERGSASLAPRLTTTAPQVAVSTRTGRATSERAGGAQPYPTMPPYIALFFCRRG